MEKGGLDGKAETKNLKGTLLLFTLEMMPLRRISAFFYSL